MSRETRQTFCFYLFDWFIHLLAAYLFPVGDWDFTVPRDSIGFFWVSLQSIEFIFCSACLVLGKDCSQFLHVYR